MRDLKYCAGNIYSESKMKIYHPFTRFLCQSNLQGINGQVSIGLDQGQLFNLKNKMHQIDDLMRATQVGERERRNFLFLYKSIFLKLRKGAWRSSSLLVRKYYLLSFIHLFSSMLRGFVMLFIKEMIELNARVSCQVRVHAYKCQNKNLIQLDVWQFSVYLCCCRMKEMTNF